MTNWFCTSARSDPLAREKRLVVDVAHVAELAGMTREEYLNVMVNTIMEGKLPCLLKGNSIDDLVSWLLESGHYESGTKFCVVFSLSVNRPRDPVIWCMCRIDLSGDEPLVLPSTIVPGWSQVIPAGFSSLDRFEIGLCDLNPNMKEAF